MTYLTQSLEFQLEIDFKVEIKMPGRNDPEPDKVMLSSFSLSFLHSHEHIIQVVIAGKSEDLIYDCIDKIRQDEDKFLDEMADRVRYDDPRKLQKQPEKREEQKVQISGAPWQMQEVGEKVSSFPPGQ